ncbi:MAG: hypothetical protein AAF958_14230 [Planctomycetota bacterium]
MRNAVDRAKKKNLSRAGAYVRRTARSSIRPATKKQKKQRRHLQKSRRRRLGRHDPTISRPGRPPRRHTPGKRGIRLILFGYDQASASVIVGPVRFQTSGNNVAQLLEHGGSGFVGRGRRKKRATYLPRPFMQPALEKESSKFPDLFRNSVKG